MFSGSRSIAAPKSSNEALKSYFGKIVPDYDKGRVYVSDIKKVILWYNLLLEKEMLNFEEQETEESEESETDQEEKKTDEPTDS